MYPPNTQAHILFPIGLILCHLLGYFDIHKVSSVSPGTSVIIDSHTYLKVVYSVFQEVHQT